MEKNLIFIVDDSEIYSQLLTNRLERKYEVKTFDTGNKALQNIHLKPSAVILDYYMDSENKSARTGTEIYQEVKKKGYDIPVIFVSMATKAEVISEIKQVGAYGYVSKEDNELIEKIESYLDDIVNSAISH